ncbi:MAG: phosphate signaling complex protein PhoU [Candidatus Aminicenantes bacterium]|nr:phosphate signaling complex protein PhoU [Candidatus Aminicenantes bacterium]
MSVHLQRAIGSLMKQLIGLSAKVEESVKRAVQSLDEGDAELARKVIKDDEVIDRREIDIEEECLKIFALHQPVAIDLRYLVAVLKINNDLERIVDLAQNISIHTLRILEKPLLEKPADLRDIYNHVQSMLKRSIDAIVNLDAGVAEEILKEDDEVDRMHHQLSAEVLEAIKKNSDKAGTLIQYIHIIRHLERIADHITNIAEDIIYLIKGEIIRHNTGLEEG